MTVVELTGKVFGRLTVLHRNGSAHGRAVWFCRCVCGTEKNASSSDLLKGHTQSCGCLMVEMIRKANTRHGYKGTRTYRVWAGMRTRCNNQKAKDYSRYGGRGIKICPEWNSFANFLRDMGDAPDGMSIERKDNCKGYEKDNCRWATPTEQARNRRGNVLVTIGGVTLTAAGWDERMGFYRGTMAKRMKLKWPENMLLKRINAKLSRSQKGVVIDCPRDIPIMREELLDRGQLPTARG